MLAWNNVVHVKTQRIEIRGHQAILTAIASPLPDLLD